MALNIGDKLNLKNKISNSKALSKTSKISEAQQYALVAVFGASVFLGIAIALITHFTNQIAFNAEVIAEEERTIVSLSNIIKDTGICNAPKGTIYSDDELKKCSPNDISASSVPNTLRANVLQNMAANAALNSVPKQDLSYCVNSNTNKNYTYSELNDFYNKAIEGGNSSEIAAATELIRICSALRVIPDALPSYRNEEAMLSSLNRIFIMSNWEPEGLSPAGTYEGADFGTNLYTIPFQLSVDASTATTMNILNNIERSIREFSISHATIEWSGEERLTFNSELTAFYTLPTEVTEETKTVQYSTKKVINASEGGES